MSTRLGKQAVVVNGLVNWGTFAAQVVIAFITSPILVRRLGDGRYGVWSLVDSVLSYLLLFDFGLTASVVRYVSKYESIRDADSRDRVLSTSLSIFGVTGAVACLISVVLGFGVARFFHIPAEMVAETRWMFILLGMNVGIGLPMSVFPSVLAGLGHYPSSSLIRLVGMVARAILGVAIVESGGGLIELACAISAVSLFEHVAMVLAVRRLLPGLRISPRLVDRTTFRSIRDYSVDSFIASLASRVSFQTDAMVIGAILGAPAITGFAIANRLVDYAKSSVRSMTMVLTPTISSMEARGDLSSIRRILVDGTRLVLYAILPVQVGLVIFGGPFLRLWMGPRYVALSYPTLVILSSSLALALSQSISGRIFFGMGRLRWFSRVLVAEAAANLLMSAALARPLGIEGVALGTAIPNVFVNLAQLAQVCVIVQIPIGTYLRRSFLKPVVLTIGLAAGWTMLVAVYPPTAWSTLILEGAAGLLAYAPAVALADLGWDTATRTIRRACSPRRLLGGLRAARGIGGARPGPLEGDPVPPMSLPGKRR